MRIGLNLLYLVPGETGGSEIYARELVPELASLSRGPLFLFAAPELADEMSRDPWADGLHVVRLPVSGRTRVRRAAAEQALLPVAAARARVDVLHSLATTSPALSRAPSVVTVHDLIYKRFPDAHRGALTTGMSVLVPLAVRRATRVIAISQAVKDDIVHFLGAPAGKIDVVPHGPGAEPVRPTPEAELRQRLRLGDSPIVFSPSARRAHKNLDRLIEAFARLATEPRPILVVPGYETGAEAQLAHRARALGVEQRLRLTGWLEPADLEGLYRAAAFVAFPSLAEGFGLPVVEAMRRGAPVLCSTAPALLELADGAALMVDPLSVDDLAGAMARLLRDEVLRAELAGLGRARASRLSWRKAAESTVGSYARAVAASSG